MAISHVGSVAGAANQTTTCTITLNFATAAGDIVFVAFTNGGADALASSITGTAGLTFASVVSTTGAASTDMSGALYWARATGDHNGQTVIGNGFTNSSAGEVTVLRGCKSSGDPFAATNSVLNASGTNTLTAVNASGVAGCWAMLALCTDDNITSTGTVATDPATVTIRGEHLSAGGVDTGALIAAAAMSGAGSTGGFSWSNARGAGIFQIALAAIILAEPDPNTKPAGAMRARVPWVPISA